METDDSIFLTELTRRMNECLSQGHAIDDIDITEIENDIIYNANIVPGWLHADVVKHARRTNNSRLRTGGKVRREIAERWSSALDCLGACLSIADLINVRLVDAVFSNGNVLRRKQPRPIPDQVTGAYLKCLNLLSLYGKSCLIATEITHLLREGFPSGAMSRFRTLHEHVVVGMVLLNDHTYELSEGFQESAVFERLKQLRADLEAFSELESHWAGSDDVIEDIIREISEVETFANEIVARRGARFKNQYEWARPALPKPKRGNLQYRITFTDLEQLAGMDFLRRNYLMGNERIHAGAYSVINHLDFQDPKLSLIRQKRDDLAIYVIGSGVSELIGWAARLACKSISYETEEYDEYLYICEIHTAVRAAIDAFNEAHRSSSDS